MMKVMKTIPLASLMVLAVACSQSGSSGGAETGPALASITSDGILKHIRVLSSDQFEGRLPGSQGEELTINYWYAPRSSRTAVRSLSPRLRTSWPSPGG